MRVLALILVAACAHPAPAPASQPAHEPFGARTAVDGGDDLSSVSLTPAPSEHPRSIADLKAPPRQPAKVALAKLDVDGPIDPGELRTHLSRYLPEIGACAPPEATGDLHAAFTIESSGAVHDISHVEFPEPTIADCVRLALHRMRFPQANDVTDADVTFHFGG